MSLLVDLNKSNGALHVGLIPANTTGVFVFGVSAGRKTTLNVGNIGASTFDVVYYLMSEATAAASGGTRVLGKDDTGVVEIAFSRSANVGLAEVGIEVKTASGSPINIEVLESKT